MNYSPRNSLKKLRLFILSSKKNNPNIYFFLWLKYKKKININYCRGYGLLNRILKNKTIISKTNFYISGEKNCIEIGQWAILNKVTFHIQGNSNKIIIGSECRITDCTLWIEDNNCEIQIGSNTTIGGAHIAATEDNSKINIGKDCMLAYDIDIRSGDSHGIYNQLGVRVNRAKDVTIGRHVWVATRAIILKGSVIGSGSIIGTGAIVNQGNYPPDSILAGNPAKIVKSNIQWTRSR